MSRYRRVEIKTWLDDGFRSFSAPQPNAQTLWLYLLCGPRTTIFPGLVVGRQEVMASDLGWNLESFRKAFVEASAKDRLKVDWRAGIVVLTRGLFDSHGDPRESSKPGNPNILKGWAKEWDQIPECALKDEYLLDLKRLCETIGESFREAFDKALGKAYAKALAKPSRNQEQEQKQEQEGSCGVQDTPLFRLQSKTAAAAKEIARDLRRKTGHVDHVAAREYWMAYWQRRFGLTATWNGKHGRLLNAMLTQHGLAEVKRRIDLLEASSDQWHRAWDFGAFAVHSDKLIAAATSRAATAPQWKDEL